MSVPTDQEALVETPGLFCVYGVLCGIAAQAAPPALQGAYPPPKKKSAPWAGNPGGEVLAVLMAPNLARYLGRCKVLGWVICDDLPIWGKKPCVSFVPISEIKPRFLLTFRNISGACAARYVPKKSAAKGLSLLGFLR